MRSRRSILRWRGRWQRLRARRPASLPRCARLDVEGDLAAAPDREVEPVAEAQLAGDEVAEAGAAGAHARRVAKVAERLADAPATAEGDQRPPRVDRVAHLHLAEQRQVVRVLHGGEPAHVEVRLLEEWRVTGGEVRLEAQTVAPARTRLPVEEALHLVLAERVVAADLGSVPRALDGEVRPAPGVEQVVARVELEARAQPRRVHQQVTLRNI